MPCPLRSFIDDFILLINELATEHTMQIVGDFILDQMLPKIVAKVDPLIQNFNLSCIFNVHNIQLIYVGGTLDLLFDSGLSFCDNGMSGKVLVLEL